MLTKRQLFAGALGLGMLFSAQAMAAEVLKLSHNHPKDHPVHKAMQIMAKRAEELSGGEIRIRLYPNAELGTQRESLELVQKGTLALAKSNAAELEAFNKSFSVFNYPYLFKDRDHYYRVLLSDTGKEILESSKDKGFIGMAYYDAGSRSFYAKKPINSPDDLKGMKVRVQPSPSAIEMIRLLGGSATPLDFGELYSALQQGLVDAAENNPSALTLNRHGEVAKFFSFDEHTIVPDILVISTQVWERLSDKSKQALQQAADESMREMKTLWEESEKVEIEKAKKMGVSFSYPEKEPFRKAVEPMYDDLKANDPDLFAIIEKIRSL